MQDHGQLFNAKILQFSMVAEFRSSSWDVGSTLSSLCPSARHSHTTQRVLHSLGRVGLISLFSGSLGQSDILSAKNDAEKNLCLSCSLRVTQEAKKGERVCLLLTRAQQWKEVAAFGFHETTQTRREAKVALLGQGRMPQRPDSQPFLWTKKDFMLSRLLWPHEWL